MSNDPYALLRTINDPSQLRQLSEANLPTLADQLRRFLVKTVSESGGHLAAGLGTVELTIALHYVYNTPKDILVWDVGHQTYPHKILTGRREQMPTMRQYGGIAGFPKREECVYDNFGVGHSSTSVSAALGMCLANERLGIDKHVVAVIGDGALTAGMAFEALNHAGDLEADMLVILNDNDMSISPNVGALSKYLARILSGRLYSNVREGSKKTLQSMPAFLHIAKRAEEYMKGMVIPGTLFEELGFNYLGPIDGHDLSALVPTLRNLKSLKGPQFLHVVTQKGKGYPPAEADPCVFHGVGPFDPQSGEPRGKKKTVTYTHVFGHWICDMAHREPRLVGITPAMREGSGLVEFSQRFADRYYDVGIAEQHSVTLAAGLACENMKPVVAIYSTFLQRAYDQLIHDVCIQNLPVLFAIDRGGIVGPDGPTHAGSFDLSYLRCIPNMVVMAPATEAECRLMLTTGFNHDGPAAVRYPRGCGPGILPDRDNFDTIPIGQSELRREGNEVALLAFGACVEAAEQAAETLDATVINMRFVKPLDREKVVWAALRHKLLVTVEDNAVAGGAGSGVSELLASEGLARPIIHLGLPDRFVSHGGREELLSQLGLDAKGIVEAVQTHRKQLSPKTVNTV